ncbi:Major Facilitator Superfamily protein [Symmachiella macrocystis]|uniref:Major Facilitator Superfamily protein n=1 Tax=Symmachiella macrocystis TaxID=2527985 RepID=A0A5C6BS88_9PLAN|nr:MFS transporter [Symmachiella macrocystis]TWU14301.1 Major Facilitator Superfamily protein [Symmachiella macrocystis]
MKPSDNLDAVTRAVLWNSMLWTAGNALTSGGFLSYFASELDASPIVLAVLMATPETVGIMALAGRPIIRWLGDRKRTWFVCSLISRGALCGIPLLAIPTLRPTGIDPVWIMIGCLAVAQAAQAVAFVAYFSWLSDLVPGRRWGRFFALRQIATLVVLLVVPVAAGYARGYWRSNYSDQQALWALMGTMLLGIALLLLSLGPMLRIRSIPVQEAAADLAYQRQGVKGGSVTLRGIIQTLADRPFRRLCFYSWWLAFWSGLTQVVIFKFLYGPLAISLGTYYLLSSVMKLVQIPISWKTGVIADRLGNKTALILGVLATAVAMLFFCLAGIAQWWWVFGAYVMWGGWGAVNIAAPNLMLKLSPPSDNAANIALFRHVAGLIAGVSGMLGGFLFAKLAEQGTLAMGWNFTADPYQVLFLISFVGRALTVFWILPLREPAANFRVDVEEIAPNVDNPG